MAVTCWRIARSLLVVVLLAVVGMPTAARESSPVLRLMFTDASGSQPGVFDVLVESGDIATLSLQIRALGEGLIDARLRVASVTSAVNGGVQIADANTEPAGPAAWIDTEVGAIQIDPAIPTDYPVTIRPPETAPPGLYVAAIVLQANLPIPIPQSDVVQSIATTALIGIRIPGESIAAFEVGSPLILPQPRGTVLQMPITNTGTVPISPTGTLTLSKSDRSASIGIPVRMGAIFSNTTTTLSITLPNTLLAGNYDMNLVLTDTDTGAATETSSREVAIPELDDQSAPTVAASSFATPTNARIGADAESEVQFVHTSIRAEGDPVLSLFIEAQIANTGMPLPSSRLVLIAMHDGLTANEVILADQISLATGNTTISTRHAPENGFGGTSIWTFSLRLETTTDDGQTSVLAESGPIAKIDMS